MAVVLFLAFISVVLGHGHLVSPTPRTDPQGTQTLPVTGGPGVADFICKSRPPQTPTVTVAAGSQFTITTNIGNSHVGDCAVYISYDSVSPNPTSWIKIANLPDCKKGNTDVITIPPWLKPSAHAVLRWEWYALHTRTPTGGVEFYANCADVIVTNAGTSTEPDAYVTMPGHLPAAGSAYRDGFAPGPVTEAMMTGPPLARSAATGGGTTTTGGTPTSRPPQPCTVSTECSSGVCTVEGTCFVATSSANGNGGAIAAAVIFAILFVSCIVFIVLKKDQIFNRQSADYGSLDSV